MISVVIATHNRIDDLKSALLSIYAQTRLPFEIVIVDDGSRPKVPDDIFAGCPVNVRRQLIRNEVALKASGARNVGIKAASGLYIAFLDDDDQFLKNKIEMVTEFIEENNFPDVVYHPARINMVNEGVVYTTNPPEIKGDLIKNKILIGNVIGGTPLVISKRSALIEAGLFDTDLPALEDYELWLRMALRDYKFSRISSVLTECFYTTRKDSVSKNVSANNSARLMILRKYKKVYQELSGKEEKRRNEAVLVDDMQRLLLNYQYGSSVIAAISVLRCRFSLKNLLRVFVVMAGPKAAFKVRSWMG